MSSATNLAIDWTERGWIPDVLIRRGIRMLLKQRLQEIDAGDCEKMALNCEKFVEQLDNATDIVVALILLWRRNLFRPQPFIVKGENYLLKIRKEIDLVVGPCHRHMVREAKAAGRPADRSHRDSLKSMAPEEPPAPSRGDAGSQ